MCVTEIWFVDVLVNEYDPFKSSHVPFDYLPGTVLGCGGYDVRVQSLSLGIWLFTWRGSRLIAKRGILGTRNCSAKLINFSYGIVLLIISWNLNVYQVYEKKNPFVNHLSSCLRNICWMNLLCKTRFLQTGIQKNLLHYLLLAFSSWKGYFTFFLIEISRKYHCLRVSVQALFLSQWVGVCLDPRETNYNHGYELFMVFSK